MLHGKNLALRPADPSDLPLLLHWANDPAMYAGGEADHWTWRAADMRASLERKPNYDKAGRFMIVPHGGEPVGWVVYQRAFSGPPYAGLDFGYRIAPAFRRKGYATAAARLMVNQLFSRTPVNRIQAHTEPENAASQRVLEAAGLSREAVLRQLVFGNGRFHDIVMFSILRTEWGDAAAYAERVGGL